MSKQFYITTAIDYVNGQPHLGHAYEKVITDVIARARRCLGEEAFFLTGLDEHGQKVQQAAEAEKKDSQAYCDELAASWRAFSDALGISIGDFVRTTHPRHKQVVSAILSKLHANGHFYKSRYDGFYSTRQETFLTDKDRNEDGTWPEIYGEVTELSEENYYFKLSDHQQWLIDHIEANENFVRPVSRRNEVLGLLKNNELEDLCISRPKERLTWGIPLPFDPDYVTYVWFDALTNYITVPAARGDRVVLDPLGIDSIDDPQTDASGSHLWPADAHVIGKDILKFHAVYWPIMLKVAGVPLPKQILVHGWWQKNGEKISKTTGNTIDPIAIIEEWGLDAFRYYVVRELDIGPDGNWTDDGFAARYNAELVNGLGNLLNRSLKMLGRYRDGKVPARSDELAGEISGLVKKVENELGDNRLQAALLGIWDIVSVANRYVDHTEPFKLAKDPAQAGRLDEILYNLVEIARILAVLLEPFLPTTAAKMREQLGMETTGTKIADAAWGGIRPGHCIGEAKALFPRKEPRA